MIWRTMIATAVAVGMGLFLLAAIWLLGYGVDGRVFAFTLAAAVLFNAAFVVEAWRTIR